MQVRKTLEASETILELTTQNNKISLGGALGTVTLTVSAADMANVLADKYVYDLELVAPTTGVVNRLVQGNFVVRGEVTR
jgi:hypothetical protein